MKFETIVHIKGLLDTELTAAHKTHKTAAATLLKGKKQGLPEAELHELQKVSMETMNALNRIKALHDDFFLNDWH